MPVRSCSDGGRPGYRWGDAGKCYTYEPDDKAGAAEARRLAFIQGLASGDVSTMSMGERVVAAAVAARVGVRKEAHLGTMVAWRVPRELAAALAVPGGEPPERLHMTLAYWPAGTVDPGKVAAVVRLFADRWYPFEAVIAGAGRFVLSAAEDAYVLLVDSPELSYLRESLYCALCSEMLPPDDTHGFTPHVTLGYLHRDAVDPRKLSGPVPVTVDGLVVAAGDFWAAFPFAVPPDDDEVESSDPVSFEKGVVPFQDWPIGPDRTWDRAAAERRVRAQVGAEDAPNDRYRKCFLWFDAAKPDNFGSYKFLIVDAVDSALKAMPAALRASASRLPGSTLPAADKAAVRKQLDRYFEKMQKNVSSGPGDVQYAVIKADDELRYTLGVVYPPDTPDAHDEFVTDEDLHLAVLDYSLHSDRRLRLQHDESDDPETVGTWVELVRWPYEQTIEVTVPGEKAREVKLRAGTVYMGVIWDEEYWPAVKEGRLGGLSLGGRAVRVE